MSVVLQESRNEVHRDLLKGEGAFFCSNVIEQYPFLVGQNLILLTDCASFYIVRYPLAHSRPWQGFGCFPDRFILSWVSCCGMVVDEGHQVSFGGVWNLRYVGGSDEQFWLEESLILIIVFPLVCIQWM